MYVLAYVESTFLFNTVVIMGTEYQEEVTAGVGMVNAISDIISGPASGKCLVIMQKLYHDSVNHFYGETSIYAILFWSKNKTNSFISGKAGNNSR